MFHCLPRIAWTMCLCLAVLLPARAQGDDSTERLRIHGSNTLGASLVPAMVESWLRTIGFGGIRRTGKGVERMEIHAVRDGVPLIVEIEKNGSAGGFDDLVEGRAEIAMMSRAPDAGEQEAGWQLGDLDSPEQQFVIALDGLAVVVHRNNPVARLSVAQLRDVVTGKVDNWSQLGGRDAAIHLQLGPVRGGNREYLRARVIGAAAISAYAGTHHTLAQAARAVSIDPDALAVVAVATGIPSDTRTLAISDGGMAVLTTRLNLMSEDYPLVQRYRLYGGTLMSALGRSFAQYSIGRGAQQAAERAGFIAMTLRPVSQPRATDPAQPYGAAVTGASRLPLSLRFNPAALTSPLDSRSTHDLDRIVAYLRLPQQQGRQVIVVGFAHGDGSSRLIGTVRSNERADWVADYLVKQGIPVRRSVGMGASRPLAGRNTDHARYRNERVEIWLQ